MRVGLERRIMIWDAAAYTSVVPATARGCGTNALDRDRVEVRDGGGVVA